ncbi:methionyl-tRNA formyltransferase [Paenibacillus larvae]
MKLIFMGTPEFAVPSLKAVLTEGHEVAAVVTQPDRPKGRKRVLTPPPVKIEAEKHGIPVYQPEKLRQSDVIDRIREIAPDLIVTAAYGQILPKSLLEVPRLGCINIHASLLPKYRGGAPIHHAVMNGDPVTGVTIMYMAEGLDTGDMISKVEVPIMDEDTAGSMFKKLAAAGADLLRRTLPGLMDGSIQAVPQNEKEAVYSPNITRENEKIDWSRTSLQIFNQIRGLNPFPGAYTLWNGAIMKVWACQKPSINSGTEAVKDPVPGTVLSCTVNGIEVATGDGSLILTTIQSPGKKAMNVAQFARGSSIPNGTILGEE